MIIESGISLNGFGIREIKVEGFKNTFALTRVYVENTLFYNFVVMEQSSGVILITARTIHGALYKLNNLLKSMEQTDLNDMLAEC